MTLLLVLGPMGPITGGADVLYYGMPSLMGSGCTAEGLGALGTGSGSDVP